MYCDTTARIRAGIEQIWEEAALYRRLSEAACAEEYLSLLQQGRCRNTLSFCLRRYIYLRFTGRDLREEPIPYTVSFDGQVYVFSPVSPDVDIDEREKRYYAELMHRMTLHHRCFQKNKLGIPEPGKAAISKQQYLDYLNDRRPYRENLFLLSAALDFDTDTMTQFMSMLGESPVYNFRSADECIFYFCHCVPTLNSWETAEELSALWREIRKTAVPSPGYAGVTAGLNDAIDDIVYSEELTDTEKKDAFADFLRENAHRFTHFSLTAKQLLAKELNCDLLLDTVTSKASASLPTHLLNDFFVRECEVEDISPDKPGVLGDGIFDDLMAARYRDQYARRLKVRALDLDSRMTANLLDGAHLRRVFKEGDPTDRSSYLSQDGVTKQDILLLRFLKFSELLTSQKLTEPQRLALAHLFRISTDRVLLQAGLPRIYAANPLDHMVLTALCRQDPAEFTRELYFHAAKEVLP